MSDAPKKQSKLRDVIDRRAVRVVFQPIVDLNDGLIIAYEALCRPEPGNGLEDAEEMFHTAEECGLLWELEELTRGMSIEAAADWPRDIRLFLNTSPSVFADERFTRVLNDDLLQMKSVSADRIVLEITERSDTHYGERLLRQVETAKKNGFHVAVDDAGAGTSGLNRMMVVRPQWIKLDRQLISGIQNDPFKQNLVRFFVHFARMSGVNVIAEGIEEAEELSNLIGLGVRFGQGYYLGRPGERAQTMDAQFVSDVRERWARVDAAVPPDPKEMPLARLSKPVLVMQVGMTSAHALAQELRNNPDMLGVVTMEGRRLLGWIDRETLLAMADGPNGNLPASMGANPIVCALTPDSTVHEALQLVCTREDHDLGQPLVIASGNEIPGAVRLRELLRAAATETRGGTSVRAAVTGLPARVRADQHIEQMIVRGSDPARRMARDFHADAAFIDIRRFADYNGVFGYEMGDRLIRALGDEIGETVTRGSEDVFLAHLGDDRFVVTARSGVLDARLPLLMQAFERLSPTLTDASVVDRVATGTGIASSLNRDGPRMGLRVLMMPGVFEYAEHIRDVYRLEQQLRQRARNQEQAFAPGQSLMVVDRRAPAIALRRSA